MILVKGNFLYFYIYNVEKLRKIFSGNNMEGYSIRNTKSVSTSNEEARSARNKLSATDLKQTEEYTLCGDYG